MDDFTHERWLPAVGWEGLYEVSDLGRVRGLDRMEAVTCNCPCRCATGKHWRSRRGKIIAPRGAPDGYLRVNLYRNGRGVQAQIHRLVAHAFIGPLPTGMETLHGLGGQQDNRIANLRYGTRAENVADMVRAGTQSRGSARPLAKLTEDSVRQCRERYAAGGVTVRALALEFEVSRAAMRHALSGETWRHVA